MRTSLAVHIVSLGRLKIMRIKEQKPIIAVKTFFACELAKMAEGKNLSETSKKHWRHKPYKNDFGGGK